MDNSSIIGFGLVAGFFVFITVRGELPAYLCVVGIGSGCPAPQSGTVPTSINSPVTSIIQSPTSLGGGSNTSIDPSGGNVSTSIDNTAYLSWLSDQLLSSGYQVNPGATDVTITYPSEDS